MTVEANAKVNFTLEVFGKRADGYHALRSVVMPISLSDTLDIEVTDNGEITSDTGYDDDLCVKAARVLRNVIATSFRTVAVSATGADRRICCYHASRRDGDGTEKQGAIIRVTKRIPAGGGLGGGSADAAAVLRALNELWKIGLSREELAEVGAQVGSDVPALVLGGPVIMEGRGEKTTPLSISTSSLHLVLVNPGVHSSTKEVYVACEARPLGGEDLTAKMVSALQTADLSRIAAAFMNDLQPPAVKLHPEIADALVSMKTAGVIGAMMSGSGSSVFGLVPDSVTAERISAELNFKGLQSWPVQTL